MVLWRLSLRYLKPYWRLFTLVVIFQFIQAIASLYLPNLNAAIIDQGVARGDTAFILSTGLVMLGITLVQIVASIIAVYFGARIAMAYGRDLRSAIFHHVNEFSEKEMTSFGAPSLITRNTNDVQQIQMLILMTCTLLVSAPILAIGGIVMALQQDLQLSWLLVVSIPALLIVMGMLLVRMVPLFRVMQKRIDRINQVLREQLTGIRVVRAFVREKQETARFAVANDEVTDAALRTGRLMALMFPVVMLVLNVSSVAVLWFGSFQVDAGDIQVGTLMAFLQYLMQILFAVMMSTFMAIMIPRAAVCADRITEVLDTPSSVVRPESPVTSLSEHGTVSFENVSFAYPGAEDPVLSDLTFDVPSGSTVAIIGSTGSGKTTLINLIPRLFDRTNGRVLVDGVDVDQLDPDLLWSRIGLIPQKPYLFSGTVASNLRFGNPDATDEELWEALRIAQAADFVREMPSGIDSPVAQGGTTVSGGQRQRLAIARALVKRAEIYIFDDSFSALDTATDGRLRRALSTSMKGTTKIIVAQRVSTIMDADMILVLEHGRIVGQGTHRELLESNETYQEIVSSQLSAEEAA